LVGWLVVEFCEFGEFGWSGVVRAAGIVFFAFVGFDMVSASSNEAINPKRDIPLALMLSLLICTILYISMCMVMTGLVSYTQLNVPHPVFVAISQAPQLAWLRPLINLGAIIGLASAMLFILYGQARVFYAMAKDRLVPDAFGKVSPIRRIPLFGTWFVGVLAALMAGMLPIQLLGELVSIGTLSAFAMVCVGVLALRKLDPDRIRGFRVPFIAFVAPAGVATCVYMMVSLPGATWIRFIVWLALGFAIYFFYGRHRSKFAKVAGTSAAPTATAN
jgi:APA family basic amino acid/polyamine antiporter